MLKELGQIANLMKNLPRIKEELKGEMDRLQQRLAQITAEGDAGAGMVRVRVNGRQEVLSCTLSDEAMKMGDREVLEDLIRAAANQALERVRHLVAEETGKVASNLGLPAQMDLPGFSLPGQ